MQLGIFEGRGPNQKKGTLQIISRIDVKINASFSNSEAKAEIKDIFQFRLSKTYQATNMSTQNFKQLESGKGNATERVGKRLGGLSSRESFQLPSPDRRRMSI